MNPSGLLIPVHKDFAQSPAMALRIATLLSVFLSLWAFAAAASIPKTDYDVIVVGGGPAGLSAISGVSRVRRTALLFDSQEYRNGVTREMHDVIGNDGELQLFPRRVFPLANMTR